MMFPSRAVVTVGKASPPLFQHAVGGRSGWDSYLGLGQIETFLLPRIHSDIYVWLKSSIIIVFHVVMLWINKKFCMWTYCHVILSPCIWTGLQKTNGKHLIFFFQYEKEELLSFLLFFFNSMRRQNVNKWSTLDKIREAHISEVSSHATALAVLVPQWGPLAGLEPVWGEATAGAEAARTVPLGVALDPTQDAGGTLLWQKSSPPPQIKMCPNKSDVKLS